jgi:hypothetical protein
VKSAGVNFGNDQFLVMGNFAEMNRRIQWLEIEFSYSLSPEPQLALSVNRERLLHAASKFGVALVVRRQ